MKQIFNELPRPTFRWMRVNHQELETPEVKLVPEAAVEERHEGSAEVTFFTGPAAFRIWRILPVQARNP